MCTLLQAPRREPDRHRLHRYRRERSHRIQRSSCSRLQLVKVVQLDLVCRQQQVNDGCFEKLDDVPTHALSLTVPALMRPKYVFCMVPAETKAQAVYNTINNAEINETCPATILRTHDAATLYIEPASAALLK